MSEQRLLRDLESGLYARKSLQAQTAGFNLGLPGYTSPLPAQYNLNPTVVASVVVDDKEANKGYFEQMYYMLILIMILLMFKRK